MMPSISGSGGEHLQGRCKIYAGGIWIASGDFTLFPDKASGNFGSESGRVPMIGSLRITDGERDIAATSTLVAALILECEDGRWCAFAPIAGNASSGHYQIRTFGKLHSPPLLHE